MSHLDIVSTQDDYRPRGAINNSDDTLKPRETSTTACCLTEPDVRLLKEAVAINGGIDTPIGRMVAEKLRGAELKRGDVPDEYVTLNSTVVFRVDGRSPLNRVLVHWNDFVLPGLHLSLHTPWGMTLLGMKAGSEATLSWRGCVEKIRVEAVTHPSQPESCTELRPTRLS